MALDLELSDLARLDRVRSALAANDPRGQFASLDMGEVVIADGVMDRLLDTVDRYLAAAGRPAGAGARVRMLADPVVMHRDGEDLKAAVFRRLASRYDASWVTLDDGHPVLHADEPVLADAAAAAVGADAIVSVGSGTITDVAKIAAQRSGVPVHVVVQTAASVDGFTDNFSVVLQNGVKKTLLSRWPDAVLTDTRTVAGAPHVLNASGFGELLSMYSGPGDWFLASHLGVDASYAPVLVDLLALCGEGIEAWSGGIGTGEASACGRLAAALAMRGIVTGVGGTTAPLSGMEHLYSHMLDMVHAHRGEQGGLHGAQVGVGCVIRAAAWELFCERMAERPIDVARLFPDPATLEALVLDRFASLDPSGRIGAECWGRYRRKLADLAAVRTTAEAFFADWSAMQARHDRHVLGSAAIATCLQRAQAAKRGSDLDPAPSPELTRWVLANCQFMRERVTVADLLYLAGWWDDAAVDTVLARVEAACAAAESAR